MDWYILDDAHSVGVLGSHGCGTPDYFNIQDDSCRTSATLAKALGGFGGVIWGLKEWVDRIDRSSRICAGASPPPLVAAAASAAALSVAGNSPEIRRKLSENVARVRSGLNSLGWELPDSPVPIICLEARHGISLERTRHLLLEQDIAVELVRSYTSTPAGGALRIAIFASHSAAQIDKLVGAIGHCI